MAKYNRKERTF